MIVFGYSPSRYHCNPIVWYYYSSFCLGHAYPALTLIVFSFFSLPIYQDSNRDGINYDDKHDTSDVVRIPRGIQQ